MCFSKGSVMHTLYRLVLSTEAGMFFGAVSRCTIGPLGSSTSILSFLGPNLTLSFRIRWSKVFPWCVYAQITSDMLMAYLFTKKSTAHAWPSSVNSTMFVFVFFFFSPPQAQWRVLQGSSAAPAPTPVFPSAGSATANGTALMGVTNLPPPAVVNSRSWLRGDPVIYNRSLLNSHIRDAFHFTFCVINRN